MTHVCQRVLDEYADAELGPALTETSPSTHLHARRSRLPTSVPIPRLDSMPIARRRGFVERSRVPGLWALNRGGGSAPRLGGETGGRGGGWTATSRSARGQVLHPHIRRAPVDIRGSSGILGIGDAGRRDVRGCPRPRRWRPVGLTRS